MNPITSNVASLYGQSMQSANRARSTANITKAANKGEENATKSDSSYSLDISDAGRAALSEDKLKIEKNESQKAGAGALSQKAEDFLAKLKEKYKDYDFFVTDDLDAEDATAGATKKYSVLIKPEELEKMAADEEYADKMMGKVDEAVGITKRVEESGELGEGVSFKKIAIKIDDEGNMKMFAELEKMSEAQMKRMEEAKEKRAEEKAEAEKADKAKADEPTESKEAEEVDESAFWVKTAKVEADNEEDFLAKILGINWDEIEAA